LQDLDNKIKNWQQIEAETPGKLAQARENLTALEAQLTVHKERLVVNSRRLRQLEVETADLTQRRITNQTRQLKARNNEEYRAVLKEAETINNQLSSREDELLSLMDENEKMEAIGPGLEEEVKKELEIFTQQASQFESILQEGRKKNLEDEEDRKNLLTLIPAEFLSRFSTVAKNRDGQAMSPMRVDMCGICRLKIPPQLFNELQTGEKMLSCPNCGRIMYWTMDPLFKDFVPVVKTVEGEGDNKVKAKSKSKSKAKSKDNFQEQAEPTDEESSVEEVEEIEESASV
jgi:predicted  nucleic acid-binding Zn-ribbon protein